MGQAGAAGFLFYGDKSSLWLGLESFLTLLRSLRHFLGRKDTGWLCVCVFARVYACACA